MKISLEKIKNIFKWRNLHKTCWEFLLKRGKWVVFILLFALFAYSGYLWYAFIYKAQWSESRKKEYVSTKDKGAIFNNSRFSEVVNEWQKRRDNYGQEPQDIKDIFGLNN